MVIGIRDESTRKKLLQHSKLSLKVCVDIYRANEQTDRPGDRGGIVKVGGTLPDKVVLVNFGALIPNIVVIPKGVAVFSLYFSFKPRFDENRTISLLY